MTAEDYLNDADYPDWFAVLGGLRRRVAAAMPLAGGRTLDLAAGFGYFSAELARLHPRCTLTAMDIAPSDTAECARRAAEAGFAGRISAVRMDAARMGFHDRSFDDAVNFLGLEDIHMTRGGEGVRRTFAEVGRVAKPGGHFCFTAMPPDTMETGAQRLETDLYSFICGSTWLREGEYLQLAEDAGFKLVARRPFYTGRKLTSRQARSEIEFACRSVPEIYGVPVQPFERVWDRFGERIEKEGLGQCSKVVLYIARKSERAPILTAA